MKAAVAASVMAWSVMTTSVVMTSVMNLVITSVMNISGTAMLVMTISEGSGRRIGDGSIGDDHVSGDDNDDE